MSIFPAAFLPSEIRSSSKLGSCRSDPRRFRCLPNAAVVERDALGAPTHRSLWGGTQNPSPFTYLRDLSNACPREDTSELSPRTRALARARSRTDPHHGEEGPWLRHGDRHVGRLSS